MNLEPLPASPPSERWPSSFVIGLDVGGTKIAGGIVEFPSGLLSGKRLLASEPGRGGKAVLEDALKLTTELIAEHEASGRKVAGIGVALAELVDHAGRPLSGALIDWRTLWPRQAFARQAQTVLAADSRAAALAEATFGAGQPFRSFYYVTIGTGIGSCLVLEGRPYAGAHCSAGTLASSPMPMWCDHCGGRSEMTLERFASGPALAARYSHESGKSCAGAEEVLAAAQAGDAHAARVVETGAEALGATLGLMINVLDPAALIVGGGLGAAPGPYWEKLVTATRAHIWADTNRELPILQGALGAEAGVIGAATAFACRVGLSPRGRAV
jgi:glucokinase